MAGVVKEISRDGNYQIYVRVDAEKLLKEAGGITDEESRSGFFEELLRTYLKAHGRDPEAILDESE